MITLIVLLLFTVYIFYRIRRFYNYDIYFKDIPTEFSYPILGNAFKLGFSSAEYLKNLTKWWKKFGNGIFKVEVGSQILVLITDPDDAETILSSTTNINKMDEYKFFHPWLGEGLAFSGGTRWHQHRKMLTPAFHFNMLKSFLLTMNEKSTKFVEVLKEKANEKTFDIQPLANCFTMDVICETAMGIEMNSMGNHESEIVKYYFDLTQIIVGRWFSAFKRMDCIFRFTNDYKNQTHMINVIQNFNQKVISKRRVLLKNKVHENNKDESELFGKQRQALLDTVLTATIDEKPLTNKQISDEVSTFIFAGGETTACGISFVLYCLSIYPELQKKMFAELFSVFGNDINRRPTYQEIQDLHYLDMFVKECYRFYPIVPFFGRKLSTAVKLSGRDIPSGTNVIVFAYAMHFNQKVFSDPEKFIPERFSAENRTGRHPYEYVPFSAGPRNCIGQKFSILELKAALSAIVRNYIVLPADDVNYKPRLAAHGTLKSTNGILIKLKPRLNKERHM